MNAFDIYFVFLEKISIVLLMVILEISSDEIAWSRSRLFLDDIPENRDGTLQSGNLYLSAVCFGERLISHEIVTKYNFLIIFEKRK